MLAPWKKSYDKSRQHIKKQRYHFANKGLYVKTRFFPVVTYRWKSWTIKKAECWRIDAFELWCWRRLLRVPRTAWRLNQSILKKINPEYSLEKTDAEVPIFWPLHAKSRLIGKDPDAGKDWRQEKKVTTENVMVGWHHWLNGHNFEQTLGDGEGQESLECWGPSVCKESDTTEWLNNNRCLFLGRPD